MEITEKKTDDLLNFLNLVGLDKMGVKDKILSIKNLDFDKFIRLILIARKKIGFDSLNTTGNVISVMKTQRSIIKTFHYEDFIGPENVFQKIKTFFENMKIDLNEVNYKNQIGRFILIMIYSQLFNDGNGRTGRILFKILTGDGDSELFFNKLDVGEKDKFYGGSNKEFIYEVILTGIRRIYSKYMSVMINPQMMNLSEVEGNIVEIYNSKVYGDRQVRGNMAYIDFLAAHLTLLNSSGFQINKGIEDKIDIGEFDKSQLELYNRIRNGLIEEIFEEGIEYIDQNLEYLLDRFLI